MTRGGQRKGAGRPSGTGRWREATRPVRVPESKIKAVKDFIERDEELPTLPLFSSSVPAGTPSPADDHVDDHVNLHDYFGRDPESTFFLKAKGNSMIEAGIYEGSIMVVDKSITPRNGQIVIAAVDDEPTVKRLEMSGNQIRLMPENPDFDPIEIADESELTIWGVVTSVIQQM